MRVLVACEYSATVADAFRLRGHEAYSCDILPTDGDPQWHYQGDATEVLSKGWDLLIGHPPCTYLTNSGVRHLHDHTVNRTGKPAKGLRGSARWVAMFEGAEFFNSLWQAHVDKICIENPIPHKYSRALIGKYDQIVQPWQFGHGETKATCLWLKNLPKLEPTDIVEGREHRLHLLPPGPERAKLRSKTFSGIANAMAEQWG